MHSYYMNAYVFHLDPLAGFSRGCVSSAPTRTIKPDINLPPGFESAIGAAVSLVEV